MNCSLIEINGSGRQKSVMKKASKCKFRRTSRKKSGGRVETELKKGWIEPKSMGAKKLVNHLVAESFNQVKY